MLIEDGHCYRNVLDDELWIPRPPRILYQNVMWPMGSTPERPSAHASSIILGPLKDGVQTLYSTFHWGPGEGMLGTGHGLIKITYNPKEVFEWFSEHERYPDNNEEFDPFLSNKNPLFKYEGPFLIAQMENRVHGNCSPFWDAGTGRFHLFYTVFYPKTVKRHEDRVKQQLEIDRRIYYKYSDDPEPWTDLNKWSDPIEWSDRVGLWARGPLVVLKDGNWLMPHNDEVTWMDDFQNFWSCRFAISKDKGKSWVFSRNYGIENLPQQDKGGIIQPTVAQLSDGSLFCMARSARGWLATMRSKPGGVLGLDWTKPEDSEVPNNDSGICLIRLQDSKEVKDHLLLIYNPTKSARYPVSIAESLDGGKSWRCLFDLRNEMGELSYPWMVQAPDGLVHCCYTLHRMTIAHDVFMI
ncbi:MAG: exo-alpha-sialidase [Promethearchaeota archaeon]